MYNEYSLNRSPKSQALSPVSRSIYRWSGGREDSSTSNTSNTSTTTHAAHSLTDLRYT